MNFFTRIPSHPVAETVGIVLVSHSERLAEGLRDLLAQLTGQGRVEIAAGTEDGGLGTSSELITQAIERADTGLGVVVLVDLGSAVLTVLDVLAEAQRDDVVLVDTPLVEGAVAAAVIAGTGADLPTVVAAAEEARDARKLP
jgi:phosphoenolpyruvate---glycerone phosphotransferase subunit DhaM